MEELKSEILSVDWEKAKGASEKLAIIGGKEVFDFLISLLESETPRTRNAAALALRDMADSQAVEPLFKAIYNKQNENNRGTLVYALQTLDCSEKLPELFDLLFYGNFEVQMGVAVVLDEQQFNFTEEDIKLLVQKWQDLENKHEIHPNFSHETLSFIKNYVEGFTVYLEDRL